MLYVSVANCDGWTAKAGQLGARICVLPTDIPNVGRFSVITDPQGAVLSIVQLARTIRPAGAWRAIILDTRSKTSAGSESTG